MSNFLSFMGFKGWKGLHLWALHLIVCFALYVHPHPFDEYTLKIFKLFIVWIGTIIFFNPFINAWNHSKNLEEMADFYHVLRRMEELKRSDDFKASVKKMYEYDKQEIHSSDEKARKFWERVRGKRRSASKLPDASTESPMPNVKPPKHDRYSHDGEGYQPEGPKPKEPPKRDRVTGEYNYIPQRPKPPAAPPPRSVYGKNPPVAE